MRQQSIKYILSFLILVSAFTGCKKPESEASKKANTASNKIQTVEVVNPANRSFIAEILITGTAKPNQTVTVYAMESGILSQIRKDIGDKVVLGETIAVLSNPALVQQKVQLVAELKGKESAYIRLKFVYDKTPALTTIQLVEKAESDYLSAKAKLSAVTNRLGFLNIKAPFSGIVTKRFVDLGSLLQSGLNEDNPQGIVEIQQTNPIRVTLPVPEADAVSLKKGMDVHVTFPELSSERYDAKITRTSGALDPLSKTMEVQIDLNNANGKIITGMYAKALFQIDSRDNILSLPLNAKVRHKNEEYVLVVKDGIVNRILIKVGLSDKDYFEVLNAEINKDSQVIISGKGLVNPGQLVNPINKAE